MKRLIYIAILLMIITMPVSSFAWEQETHMRINLEAIKKFYEVFKDTEKYKNSPVIKDSVYKGLAVTNSTKWEKDHEMGVADKTFAGWLIHGGFSADEPHLYASVRHFFDPVPLDKPWLTDQISLHGTWNYVTSLEVPNIDAKTWGISHKENPYSFESAMEYYYKALTIRDNKKPTGFFPTNISIKSMEVEAKTIEEERSLYLAAAFRALGETMHMMSDMTQPAHVRNDSHPKIEPLEQSINGWDVRTFVKDGLKVDSRISSMFISSGGTKKYSVDEMFLETAKYTNSNFFSEDTIYDKKLGVMPVNGEVDSNNEGYKSPQLSNLKAVNTNESFINYTTYFGEFNNEDIPLARRVYNTENTSYKITSSMAQKQGSVLIPVSIAACSDLIDRFFPKLVLISNVVDEKVEKDQYGNEKLVYTIDAQMNHEYEETDAWKDANLKIKYSGPGSLVITEKDKVVREIKVSFDEGKLFEIENYKKKMAYAKLKLYYKKSNETELTTEEAYYEISPDQKAYFQIEAGGRLFKSEEISFDNMQELRIKYSPKVIETNVDVRFSVDSDDELYYQWDFGDGKGAEALGLIEIKHHYEKTGNYKVSVKVYKDKTKKKLAAEGSEDIVVENISRLSISPSSNLDGKVDEEYKLTVKPEVAKYKNLKLKLTRIADGNNHFNDENDTLYIKYGKAGKYTVRVFAIDSETNRKFEGIASITIKGEEENINDPYRQYDEGYVNYDYSRLKPHVTGHVVQYYDPDTYEKGMEILFDSDEHKRVISIKYFYQEKTQTSYMPAFEVIYYSNRKKKSFTEYKYDEYQQKAVVVSKKTWFETGILEYEARLSYDSSGVTRASKLYRDSGELWEDETWYLNYNSGQWEKR